MSVLENRDDAETEARLIAQKDATIKALADALDLTGFRDIEGLWHSEDCCHADTCTAICLTANAALRLAGRL